MTSQKKHQKKKKKSTIEDSQKKPEDEEDFTRHRWAKGRKDLTARMVFEGPKDTVEGLWSECLRRH